MVSGEAAAEPFRYAVRFPAPITHYAEVEAQIPTDGAASLELFMAVWTPGSYLVREYARNIESLEAFHENGERLAIHKSRKNRWLTDNSGAASIRVTYRVYCHELSVRTNWVDEQFALLHGAATFLGVVGKLDRVHEVTLSLPAAWRLSMTGMSGTAEHYAAPDYDTLVDCPILLGNPNVYEFQIEGKKHYLVNEGEGGMWDGARSVKDIERIVQEHLTMWGSLPYERYVFLNILADSHKGDGLEHKNSFCVMASRYATRTRPQYLKWLWLVSHEYFHVWNVKRLRPIELGPFDYENENHTRQLWVSEGFTEYYMALMVHRAGLTTIEEYLSELSRLIDSLQSTPGRLLQSMSCASFDAWIKLYRPNENSINTAMSYYTKGAVIAFLLDAKMRTITAGRKSLDDAMRLAFERYSGGKGFTERDFRQTAEEIAGTDMRDWFHQAIETTEELDYAPAFELYGLRFQAPRSSAGHKAWLGFTTKTEHGRLLVATVPRGTPAFEAGFSADDEILAIGEYRVLPDQWQQRLEQLRHGEKVEVLVSRRARLTRVEATLGEEPGKRWTVEVDPGARPEQTRQLNAWLESSRTN